MRVLAFAKINLSLQILGVRADGYHDLRTLFQSIRLHDTLTIRVRRGPWQLTCGADGVPTDDSNLIARAAAAAWRAAGRRGRPDGVSVHLTKRIPPRAGLGGGSSDAAAALRTLGRVWGADDARLRASAAAIGADVGYFLEGGTVLGLDRGDLLLPLIDYPAAWVVLALPDFGVSTRDAYRWLDSDRARRRRRSPHRQAPHVYRSPERLALRAGRVPDLLALPLANDLEPSVVRRHRQIGRIVAALRQAGADHAAMSGSGSAVFGLFRARTAAVAAAARVQRTTRARTLVTRTLPRAAYRRLGPIPRA